MICSATTGVPTDEEKAEEKEESGWKLVHGIFRAPRTQCCSQSLLAQAHYLFRQALSFSPALGFLGLTIAALATALVVVFVIMGMIGGYHSARMYSFIRYGD